MSFEKTSKLSWFMMNGAVEALSTTVEMLPRTRNPPRYCNPSSDEK